MKRTRMPAHTKPIAITAAVMIAIAGCGTSSASTKAEGPAASAPTTGPQAEWSAEIKKKLGGKEITVAASTHPATDALEAMTPEFTRQTGIKVTWDKTEENGLKSKQELDASSGAARYDVLMVDAFWMADYVTKGIVQPISEQLADPAATPEFFDHEDIAPAYRGGLAEIGGKTYGVPLAGETRFVAYRTDLFEQAGLKPPATTEDLLGAAKTIQEKTGTYGIAMRGQKGIQFTSGLLTVLYQFSPGLFDEKTGATTVDTKANVEATQYFLDLLKTAPEDVGSYTHEEALSAFASGNAGLWFDATSLAPQLLDPKTSTVADKIAFAAPPKGPRGSYGALAGWSLSLAKNSKQSDAAWAFIVWMLARTNAENYMDAGGVPTRTSVLAAPKNEMQEKYYPAMIDALESANRLVEEGGHWIPNVPGVMDKLVTVGNYGSEALAGSKTAAQALTDAQRQIGS